MRVAVQFGDECASLDVADARLVRVHGEELLPPIADVSRAVAEAIESPIEFPPLRRAVVPGDHVAIVLDDGVPRPADVLGPIVECVREAGAQPHDIQVVAVPSLSGAAYQLNADALPPGIGFLRHDPSDRRGLSFLAATKEGTRIYLNRAVVDADLVVLVGRVDFDPILKFRGTASAVYPGLVDDAARQAFRARIHKPATPQAQVAARREADEIAWLLGVQFAVALVAGRLGEVHAVLAGDMSHVQREAERRLNQTWLRRADRRADLVVAAISGAAREPGFDELGRVLKIACELVSDDGRVVVLSAVSGAAGPALSLAQQLREPAEVLNRLHKLAACDVVAARQIAEACQRAHVFLMSKLTDDLVEDLGMTPLGSNAEVQRLVDQAKFCTILADAQLTHASVAGEDHA